jgi:tRNA (adenine22-N1)-methyltransferase
MVKLSDRLQLMADRIEPSKTMADIGTDHGFLPIYLIESKKCDKVIMADISEPSLDKARTNAKECSEEIQSGIEFRAGDGLKVINEGEIEAVAVAGMGGKLIRDIMADNMVVTRSVNKYVLQPRIGQGYLRKWLCMNNFHIMFEDLVIEGDYIPEIITVETMAPEVASEVMNIYEKNKEEMAKCDGDHMIWRVPPWITIASGPVAEFLERSIEREMGKLKNVMRAKTRKLALESQIRNDIKYLKGLLKEYNDGII